MSWLDALFREGAPVGRSIPPAAPSLEWEAAVPRAWAGHLHVPVVSPAGLALVACGGDQAEVALAALDLASGETRYRLALPQPAARDFSTGLPLALPDGGARTLCYWQDEELSVLHVDAAGAVRDRHVAGRHGDPDAYEKEIVASDSGIKMFLSPLIGCGSDAYLYAWSCRQVRTYRTECRAGDGTLRWHAPEWLLASTAGVTLGQENDGRHRGVFDAARAYRFQARDAASGALLWSRDPARVRLERPRDTIRPDTRAACALAGRFVLADRSEREAERAAREEAILDLMVAQPDVREQLIETFERNHALSAGEALVALDARTGAEVWRRRLPGALVSIAASEHVLAAVSETEAGRLTLHRFDAGGGAIGDSVLGEIGFRGEAAGERGRPIVVAVDHTHLLWSWGGELVCEPLGDPGRTVWRARIGTGSSFRPRVMDHLPGGEAAVTAWDGRLLVREDEKVLCWR